jgi:Na+/H+-dicarboxylate symporter
MSVNWGELGQVFVATVVAAVLVVGLFSFGVIGLSQQATAKENGQSGTGPFVGSVICFAVCVAIVGFGIYLIVAK